MTPPINIDGDTVEAITIDGTKVTEVTADGSVVFGNPIPDSVVQQFDPRERSTGTITTMQDIQGLADLSGECDVISSGINGNQSYRFDGSSSNEMLHSTTITTSDPFAVVFVIEQQTSQGSNTTYHDGGSGNEFGLDEDSSSGVDKFLRGGNVVSEPDFLDPQTPHVISTEALNGSDIKIRLDGSKIATKSASASDFTGLKIAGRRGRSDLNVQADFGQIEVLDGHTQSELESVEQRLADNYGITLS